MTTIFGRVEWVAEWSGPFEALPQSHGVYCVPDPTARWGLRAITGPMPIQPRVTPRRLVCIDDTVIVLNSCLHSKLLQATVGLKDEHGVKRDWHECVGFYVIVEPNTGEDGERVETKTSKRGSLKFERASPPASSWRAA